MDDASPEPERTATTVLVPDERCNVPSQERLALLSEFRKAMKRDKIRAPLWAFLQVADIAQLQSLVEAAKNIPEFYFSLLEDTCFSIVLNWMQRRLISQSGSSVSGTSSSSLSESSKKGRAEKPKRLAKERDQMCVLTKATVYQVAHIYPHSLIHASPRRSIDAAVPGFWKLLDAFFDTERIDKWRSEIFRDPTDPSKASDGCFNMICINSQAHELWNRGFFALKPISLSDDKKTLVLEFHWQPRPNHSQFDTVDILKCPGSSEGLDSVEDNDLTTRIGNGNKRRFIKTGDRFELRTDNPFTHPLPSWDLLDMQWRLTRVVSMSGAADVYDDDDDNDDDNSIDDAAGIEDRPDIFSWVPSPSRIQNESDDSEDNDEFEDSFTTASTNPSPAKVRETLGNTATEEGGPIEL
ncbi:hypothetical protein DTO271D3_7333 [Paecilomyces variotii]|nr:hypothetical protein DTO271D3_7333 [Paecilomyces variotii]